MVRLLTPLALALMLPGILHGADEEPRLRFVDDGAVLRTMGLTALLDRCGEQRVEVDDPYYERPMAFRALPLRCVLEAGFAADEVSLAGDDFSLIALDGYTRPSTGARLAEPGGHVAFADAALTPTGRLLRFEPITRRELDPSPFYLVWSEPGQNDPHRYPWPFQLATIERVPFERRHPHTLPVGEAEDGAAWRGFALFRSQCVMCHSINDEGGKVGPELNVPRSIVEYRPEAQLREFIRDPESFRYTAMPSHGHLDDADLDALIAYFRAMSMRKHDPRRSAAP